MGEIDVFTRSVVGGGFVSHVPDFVSCYSSWEVLGLDTLGRKGRSLDPDGRNRCRDFGYQMSRNRTSLAFFWMKLRRDSTSSPIRVEKTSSAAAASSRLTCIRVRLSGAMVVSHSS